MLAPIPAQIICMIFSMICAYSRRVPYLVGSLFFFFSLSLSLISLYNSKGSESSSVSGHRMGLPCSEANPHRKEPVKQLSRKALFRSITKRVRASLDCVNSSRSSSGPQKPGQSRGVSRHPGDETVPCQKDARQIEKKRTTRSSIALHWATLI